VGPLNPPGLSEPFLNVPNVAVGLSVLLELGKRGPRQDATSEAARAAALEALEQLRRKVLDLEDVIGDVAAAQVRVDALDGLSDDARKLTELQQARAQKGDTSDLDADRARLEQEGTVTALGEAREQLAAALRGCADVLANPCTPFADAAQAGTWLERKVCPWPPSWSAGPTCARSTRRCARPARPRRSPRAVDPRPDRARGLRAGPVRRLGQPAEQPLRGHLDAAALLRAGEDDAEAAAVAAAAPSAPASSC